MRLCFSPVRSQPAPDGSPRRRLTRWAAASVTVAMVVIVASPAFRQPPKDSFPLSTFPMFSFLIDPVVSIDYAVGIDSAGNDVTLDPATIAGTDEVIVAGSIVAQAVKSGPEDLDALCRAAASRVDATKLANLEIRTDIVDAVRWFGGDARQLSRITHWTCDVR